MSKKDLEGACIFVHVPEKDGGYKQKLLTLAELAELLPGCQPAEAAPAPEEAPAEEEAAPEEAPAKKKRRSTRKTKG